VESHYRKALAIYADLERRWPDRPQPVALCLRHLAETARARGEVAKAHELWRESIEKGERYLERDPAATAARSQLCWACIDLWQSINASSEDRIADLEHIIQIGVRHGAVLLEQNPHAPFVRDVVASLNLRLAIVYCRTSRVEEAARLFKKTVRDIDSLCADCPWNAQYWATARYIHSEALRSLEVAGRREDAKALARQMYEWVQNTATRLPADLLPQLELLQCQFHVAKCLQSLGLNAEAAELARSVMELHREFEKRPPSTAADRAALAEARLLFPVELLPAAETGKAATENLLPALRELTSNPQAFSAAAHLLIERAYQARENYKLMAALALSTAVANAARDSALLVESRIEALDEVMHNQWRLGQLDQAEATSREVLALVSDLSPRHWVEASIYGRLAEISLARRNFVEAVTRARKSIELSDHVEHKNASPEFVYVVLARALQGQGKLKEALSILEQAWKQYDAQGLHVDAGLTYYELLTTAGNSSDASVRESAARSILAYLSESDQRALDGVHLAWRAMAQRQLNAPDAAKEDWKLAFEQKIGDVKSCCFLALAQLHSGDADGYRRVCAQMVDELGTTPDEDARFRFAWACAHGPSALNDLQIPLELAAKLVEENPDCAAYQCTLGALLYRAGRFEEAVRPLSQSAVAFAINPSDQFSTLYPKLLMAMVHWELGEVKKSQELFDEVQSQYDDAINSASSWNRRATLQLLRDEAEALVSSDRARPQGNLLAETARDPSNHAPSVEHATQNKPD
jgi:tetratricopeptide (TPR) repeat protein